MLAEPHPIWFDEIKIETARGEEEEGDEENQRHQPKRIVSRGEKKTILFLARREKLCSIYICSSRPTSVNDQGRNAVFLLFALTSYEGKGYTDVHRIITAA